MLIIMSTFGITSQGYTHFPHLAYLSESRDKILFKGGRLCHLRCQISQSKTLSITSYINEPRKLK